MAAEHASKELTEFLEFLADRITLKGWNRFRGGLDVSNDETGTETFYTTFNDDEFEIIFHVSTCLPYTNDEPQQLQRKRHIGNDVVVVVFQDEGSDPFTPEHISSHFNHAFFVIEPCTQGGVTRYRYARERERPRARADEGWSSDDSMRIVA